MWIWPTTVLFFFFVWRGVSRDAISPNLTTRYWRANTQNYLKNERKTKLIKSPTCGRREEMTLKKKGKLKSYIAMKNFYRWTRFRRYDDTCLKDETHQYSGKKNFDTEKRELLTAWTGNLSLRLVIPTRNLFCVHSFVNVAPACRT
jgi:hypothetical protein